MLHMVHHDHLDKYLGKNILNITPIQVKEVVYVQNQHQYTDHFTKMILIIHT